MEENESLIDIDDTQLDIECLSQAKRMEKQSKLAAKARLAFNEAKANVDVVYAELSLDIRRNPAEYDLEKVTEPTIESAIQTQEKYQDAVKQMHLKKYKLDMTEATVTALDHRKRMIELSVQLFALGYNAEPRLERGARQVLEDRAEKRAFKPLKKKKKN